MCMRISPINSVNSRNYCAPKNNQPTQETVVNTNFTGAGVHNGIKESALPAIKKMVAAFAMLSALKIFAEESKDIFNPSVVVRKIYGEPVGEQDKDYLKKAYTEDPQLFTALAQSKIFKENSRYANEYSPAEIYGLVKVKQENPVIAYELSKWLKSGEKTGHLETPEEVLFIAAQMQQEKNNLLTKMSYSSKQWYNNLKADDINNPLHISLIHDYKNPDGRRLNSADRLAIIEKNAENPEFGSKILELHEISVGDLYILEDKYKDPVNKKAIDDLSSFLKENTHHLRREYIHSNVPASTETLLGLLDSYVVYPDAVKELCSRNLPVKHTQALARVYAMAPGITLDSYKEFICDSEYSENQLYFDSLEDLVQFLDYFINISDIIEQYEKARGHMIFSESYALVKAYNGDEKNKEALSKIISSKVIKIINPKKIPHYVDFVNKNPGKELTKEILKYADDPMAKPFGLL